MREAEKKLEARFRTGVKRIGGVAYKMMPTLKGLPDRVAFLPGGAIYFVELKAEDGAVSAIQEVRHAEIAQRGTTVYVVYGREGVDLWLSLAELGLLAGPAHQTLPPR